MGYNFEWNPKKADANLRKHGVSFAEAITVFGDPLSMNMADPETIRVTSTGSSWLVCRIVIDCWWSHTPSGHRERESSVLG